MMDLMKGKMDGRLMALSQVVLSFSRCEKKKESVPSLGTHQQLSRVPKCDLNYIAFDS